MKILEILYRAASNIDKNIVDSMDNINAKELKKGLFDSVLNIITGKNSKTFYIGGTDKYFNDNFIPDTNDFALKSDKIVKVCKTKFGATFEALKREGLSGIKQNKTRVAAGVAIALGLGYLSYKFIKKGVQKIGLADEKENTKQIN